MKKKLIFIVSIVFILFILVLLSSCEQERKTVDIYVENKVIEYSGSPEPISADLSISGGLQYIYEGIDNDYFDIEAPVEPGEYKVTIKYLGEKKYLPSEKTVNLTISMPYDLNVDGTAVTKYKGAREDVYIPSKYMGVNIVSVGPDTFINCAFIKSIKLNTSIKTFDSSAIIGCSALQKITCVWNTAVFGDFGNIALEYENIVDFTIGMLDVYGIDILKLPLTLHTIESMALSACNIRELYVHGGVSLEDVSFPVELKKINVFDSATYYSKAKCIRGNFMKNKQNIEEVVIGDSIQAIEAGAFAGCSSLKQLILGKEYSVTYGEGAYTSPFSQTSIETVYLRGENNTVNNFPDTLEKIIVEEGIAFFVKSSPFASSAKEIILPSTFKKLTYGLFSGCSNLTVVNLPDGMSIKTIPAYCFSGTAIESIKIPESVTKIEKSAFENCEALVTVTFEQGSKLTAIADQAFQNCKSLTSISLPETIVTLGIGVFTECSALTTITIPSGVKILDDSLFNGCSSLNSIDLSINMNLEAVEDTCFARCSALEKLILPLSLMRIASDAFIGCDSLVNIEFLSPYPPEIIENYWGFREDLVIYVPFGSFVAYTLSGDWMGYIDQIVEREP